MKTKIDIPEDRIKQLLDATSLSSTKEAVNTAIRAFIQDRKRRELLQMKGAVADFMTTEELEACRDD